MSTEALKWWTGQRAPCSTSKAVLKELCGYADMLGVTWAAVPTLALDLQKSERQVQRALRALEKAGLMKWNGRFHHRTVPFYQLNIDREGELVAVRAAAVARARAESSGGRRKRPVDDGLKGDMGVTLEKPKGDVDGALKGDTGDTQHQGTSPSEGKPSSGRGRAGEDRVGDVIRDRAFSAYPAAGRKGVSSKREFDEAWASEVAGGGDPADIETAIRTYAADRSLWGSSGKPVAAHNFLSKGRWADIADSSAGAAAAVAQQSRWTGPAEIRAQVEASGVRGALGLLDRSRWTGQAVAPPGNFSRDQLRIALRGTDVLVLDPQGSGG